MIIAGWIFTINGGISFLGSLIGGTGSFVPLSFLAIGIVLLYFANEKEEEKRTSENNIKAMPSKETPTVTRNEQEVPKKEVKISIKEISNGGTFMVDFNRIIVEKMYYTGTLEKMSFFSNATATILRVSNNGTIFVQLMDSGVEYPLAQIVINGGTFYHKDERCEVAQTTVVRGNEIIEELPISIKELGYGKINLFSITKQERGVVSFMIINPQNIDNYYYRITFMNE